MQVCSGPRGPDGCPGLDTCIPLDEECQTTFDGTAIVNKILIQS